MADENSDDSSEVKNDSPPFVHIDYRFFEVTVEGGDSDTLSDVNEIASNRVAEAIADIREINRGVYELEEEYSGDLPDTPSGMMQ